MELRRQFYNMKKENEDSWIELLIFDSLQSSSKYSI